MPRPDAKKVQTAINKLGYAAIEMRNQVAVMVDYRDRFTAAALDTTGTALEGNEAAVNAAVNSLNAEINGALWSGVIDAIVPSHRGRAL